MIAVGKTAVEQVELCRQGPHPGGRPAPGRRAEHGAEPRPGRRRLRLRLRAATSRATARPSEARRRGDAGAGREIEASGREGLRPGRGRTSAERAGRSRARRASPDLGALSPAVAGRTPSGSSSRSWSLNAAAFLYLRDRMSTPAATRRSESAAPHAAADPGADDEDPLVGLVFLAGAGRRHLLRMTTGQLRRRRSRRAPSPWVAAARCGAAGGRVPGPGPRRWPPARRRRRPLVGRGRRRRLRRSRGGAARPRRRPRGSRSTCRRGVVRRPRGRHRPGPHDAARAQPAAPAATPPSATAGRPLRVRACASDGRGLRDRRGAGPRVRQPGPRAGSSPSRCATTARTAALTTDSDCVAGAAAAARRGRPGASDQCFGNDKVGLGVTWAGDEPGRPGRLRPVDQRRRRLGPARLTLGPADVSSVGAAGGEHGVTVLAGSRRPASSTSCRRSRCRGAPCRPTTGPSGRRSATARSCPGRTWSRRLAAAS